GNDLSSANNRVPSVLNSVSLAIPSKSFTVVIRLPVSRSQSHTSLPPETATRRPVGSRLTHSNVLRGPVGFRDSAGPARVRSVVPFALSPTQTRPSVGDA